MEVRVEPLIEFRNVSKSFGQSRVLNNVNLSIYENEITTIIGKSGTGKSTMTDSLIQEKVTQAQAILNELGIDTWLLFARETSAVMDPMLPVIYGSDLTWQSALFINRSGKHVAIVGNFEAEAAHAVGAYGEVIPYHQSIREPLLQKLSEINPQKIAIDYSVNDSHADGLTYGMYQLLLSYLNGSPYINRLGSAELLNESGKPLKRLKKFIRKRSIS